MVASTDVIFMTEKYKINFFKTPAAFRKWLEKNHERKKELVVGFYKRGTGKPSITWPESVDEALCCGWIDGIRKRIDDESYTIRFTPRKPRSTWSTININRVKELTSHGKMSAAGLKAFEKRDEKSSAIYSYEREASQLSPEFLKKFRAKKGAWKYFMATPPWYQRTAIHWVTSAKKEETKLSRLERLIESSSKAEFIGPLARPGTQKKVKKS
jgi:uncharacterized protein YdeI (YjbR/CyaY-like superfamily)